MVRIKIPFLILMMTCSLHSEAYWVFFRDKGNFTKANLDNIYQSLPEKTRARRAKVGIIRGIELDLPPCEHYIQAIVRRGNRLVSISKWLNAASFLLTNENEKFLVMALPFVVDIVPVATYRLPLPKTAPIPPPQSHPFYGSSIYALLPMEIQKMHSLGYHGEGVRIGMLDTGAKLNHTAFDSIKIIAKWDFINNDSVISYDPAQDTINQDYHGTYTLSAIGGYYPGKLIGPAYKAEYVLAKTEIVNQEIRIEENYWVRGLEWAESLGVDIISSSLGYADWYSRADMNGRTAVVTLAANRAASLGVVVVTSAGNERGTAWNYIIAPADAESVISVGAVDIFGGIAPFSSPGPTYDGRIKPEVVALGINVASASPLDTTSIASVSGTSMSTPLVAGASALLLQAFPDLTPMKIRDTLLAWADQFFEPDTDVGWGIPSPYLSLTAEPTLYLKIFDRSNGLPFDTTQFVLVAPDTVCTLYTNARGIARYHPVKPGEYRLTLKLSANRYFHYNFTLAGTGKEVVRVPVDRNMPDPITIYPNPFSEKCSIIFSPVQEEEVPIAVYSPTGELLYEDKINTPAYEWAGINKNGKRLSSGVYIVKLKYNGETYIRKVAILRK